MNLIGLRRANFENKDILGLSEAYKEIFGEDSFEIDQKAFNNSLEMWGNFSEVWRWLPELSSPAVSIN